MASPFVFFLVAISACVFLERASCRPLAINAGATSLSAPTPGDGDGGALTQQIGTAVLQQDNETVGSHAAVGQALPGRYIVMFKQQAAADLTTATAALRRQVQQSIAAAAVTRPAAAGVTTAAAAAARTQADLEVLGSIEGSRTPVAAAAAVTAATAGSGSSSSASSNTGTRGIVVSATNEVIEHIKRSEDVASVFQDRVVGAQVRYCLQTSSLAGGITGQPTLKFKWDGCHTPVTKLIWTAQPCGKDGLRVAYTELRAVSAQTGRVLKGTDGADCIVQPNPKRPYWTLHRFGSGCGVAPLYADFLPATICSGSRRGYAPYTSRPNKSLKLPGTALTDDQEEQESQGQTSPMPEPQTSPAPETPGQSPPAPEPQPPSSPKRPTLPRIPVAEGERVPEGLLHIEAVTAEGVANTAGLPVEQQVIVGVVDSGVDATHPDINYAGGISFLASSSDASFDGYGHGTHCAGIIGAKNNGEGVVGVSPGVPIYSIRVLDDKGAGTLSGVLSAVKWAASEGIKLGIKVINLSLATYVSPTSPDYQATYDTVCGVMKEASDAGLVITAAAGNYGAGLPGYLPASCPGSVVAVTAIQNSPAAAAPFSNWLPESAVGAAGSPAVLAAPGVNVLSTLPFVKEASGYGVLSGTSMAAPHVAGVAANCIMSNACTGTTGMDKVATILAAAKDRLSLAGAPAYGFLGDATNTINGKYFSYLVSGAF